MDFNSEQLWALWGVVLSLVFGYFPVVKDWYDGLDGRWKPLIMAGGLLLLTAGKMLVSCEFKWDCIAANWTIYLQVWFYAILANIATYQVAVRQQKQHEIESEYYSEPQ